MENQFYLLRWNMYILLKKFICKRIVFLFGLQLTLFHGLRELNHGLGLNRSIVPLELELKLDLLVWSRTSRLSTNNFPFSCCMIEGPSHACCVCWSSKNLKNLKNTVWRSWRILVIISQKPYQTNKFAIRSNLKAHDPTIQINTCDPKSRYLSLGIKVKSKIK